MEEQTKKTWHSRLSLSVIPDIFNRESRVLFQADPFAFLSVIPDIFNRGSRVLFRADPYAFLSVIPDACPRRL